MVRYRNGRGERLPLSFILYGWGKCEGSLKYQWKMALVIDVILPMEYFIY